MTASLLSESMESRRQRLEEVFADDPYLSATMRAARLHERDEMARAAPAAEPRGRSGPAAAVMAVKTVKAVKPAKAVRSDLSPPADTRLQQTRATVEVQSTSLGFVVNVSSKSGKLEASLAAAPERDVMTAREAAAYLRVGVGTLRSWVRERGLPSAVVGSQRRFRKEALLGWLAGFESSR